MNYRVSNFLLASWISIDLILIIRVISQVEYIIVEIPYIIGLAIQVWYISTRPQSTKSDLSIPTVFIVIISILIPFSYYRLPDSSIKLEQLIVVMSFSCSLLFLWSVVYLHRNFAVLPAYRSSVTKGPYGFVRHPLYSSYLLLDLVFVISVFEVLWCVVWVLELVSLFMRTLLEEKLLVQNSDSYKNYMDKVKFRFIPYII